MKLLLTSAGIKNSSIHNALVDLLGKPVAESSALFIPTGIYPFRGGPGMAWQAICGGHKGSLCGLGWKSLGVLELTALPSIDKHTWVSSVLETDALLVWGGDPLFLSHWIRHSSLLTTNQRQLGHWLTGRASTAGPGCAEEHETAQ